MRRIAAIAFLFCAGCAGPHEECLWHDSFLGDLGRCICGNHGASPAVTDGTVVTSTTQPAPGPALASTPAPASTAAPTASPKSGQP